MNFRYLLCSALTAVAMAGVPGMTGAIAPVMAQEVDEFGDPVSSEVNLDFSKYRVVNAGDWRSADANVPWSTPVIVRDDFDGDYLAVFDKNYQSNFFSNSEHGIVSNWSRRELRVFAYDSVSICSGFFCNKKIEVRETQSIAIKAGDEVFRLEGKDGNYPISEELAAALRDAPPGETKIKVKLEGFGEAITSDIGKHTVSAWKTVYQDAQGAAEVAAQ